MEQDGEKKRRGRLTPEQLAEKYEAMSLYEQSAASQGYCRIAGMDEAGRGPLAGPVVAAAVILNPGKKILGVDDSKKLSPSKRQRLKMEIEEKAVAVSVGIVDVETIDRINILEATKLAMKKALEGLEPAADFVLIDALTLPDLTVAQYPIIKGDALSASIAAASIVAKETRDDMMRVYGELYPEYGFAKHKGYGTKDHIDAIRAYGPSPLHRRSFLKEYRGSGGAGVGRLKNPGAVGRQKERKAAIFLSNKGYHILEHSYRSPCGEIDLIAEQGGRIIFVEVKYRRSLQCGLPSEAVNRGKQRRITKAAYWYVRERHLEDRPMRFDIVEMTTIDGRDAARHIEHAFYPTL